MAESSSAAASSKQTVAQLAGLDLDQWKRALGALAFKKNQNTQAPSPGAGDRVFYESCFRENPSCDMALIWCIEHGIFMPEEHDSLLPQYDVAKRNRKPGGGGSSSAAPSASPAKAAVPGVKAPKKRSTVVDSSAIAVDVGMSTGSGDGIGAMQF